MKWTLLVCIIVLLIPSFTRGQDLLYDQSATGQWYFIQCMHDSTYPFTTKLCDNFSVSMLSVIDSVVWWGGYWSYPSNELVDFTIEIYGDSTGQLHPYEEPFYSERVAFIEEDLGGYYKYSALIPACTVYADLNYYITFMATIVFPPNWGNNSSYPGQTPGWGDGNEAYFKSDLFGYDEWTPVSEVNDEPFESSFQLYSLSVSIDEQPDVRSVNAGLSVFPTACLRSGQLGIAYTVSEPGHSFTLTTHVIEQLARGLLLRPTIIPTFADPFLENPGTFLNRTTVDITHGKYPSRHCSRQRHTGRRD